MNSTLWNSMNFLLLLKYKKQNEFKSQEQCIRLIGISVWTNTGKAKGTEIWNNIMLKIEYIREEYVYFFCNSN